MYIHIKPLHTGIKSYESNLFDSRYHRNNGDYATSYSASLPTSKTSF